MRPAEPAGVAEDIVRAMDPKTFQIPKQATDAGKRLRRAYIDAIRDGVAKGDCSEFVLSEDEARRRAIGPTDSDALSRWPTFGWASTCSRRVVATKG